MPSTLTKTADAHTATARRFQISRPEVSPLVAGLLVTGFIMAFDNATFWARGYDIFDGQLRQLGVFGLAIGALLLHLAQRPRRRRRVAA